MVPKTVQSRGHHPPSKANVLLARHKGENPVASFVAVHGMTDLSIPVSPWQCHPETPRKLLHMLGANCGTQPVHTERRVGAGHCKQGEGLMTDGPWEG